MKLDFGILYNIQDDRLARVKLLNQMDHSTCITTIWHLIFRDVAVNQSIPKPVPVQNKYTEIQTHVCCDPMCSQHAKIRVWRLIDDFVDTYGDGEITRVVYDVQLAWCILTGEMGHPPRRKCDKIYKRNVSSFRELSFKKLSWVFPVNHSQQYKTTPPSPAVSLPFFKLNRPSDGSKLSQNRESWGKKLQKEPASQANPFNVNNSGRKWISKYGFTLLKEADSIRKICSSFWCRDIPFVYRFECVTVGPHVLPTQPLQFEGTSIHTYACQLSWTHVLTRGSSGQELCFIVPQWSNFWHRKSTNLTLTPKRLQKCVCCLFVRMLVLFLLTLRSDLVGAISPIH